MKSCNYILKIEKKKYERINGRMVMGMRRYRSSCRWRPLNGCVARPTPFFLAVTLPAEIPPSFTTPKKTMILNQSCSVSPASDLPSPSAISVPSLWMIGIPSKGISLICFNFLVFAKNFDVLVDGWATCMMHLNEYTRVMYSKL